MTITASQWICVTPVKLWDWIPTPFICAQICELVNDSRHLRCPKCGTCRPYVMGRKTGVA